jgi:hypothetical protein
MQDSNQENPTNPANVLVEEEERIEFVTVQAKQNKGGLLEYITQVFKYKSDN